MKKLFEMIMDKGPVRLIKDNIKVIFSALVIIILACACISSVIQDRRKVTKDMGRMVSLNALYDEPAMKPLYARTAYETLSLTTVAASSSGIRSDDIGAYSDGKNLTDQQLKDKAALEALLENTKSSRTSKGAEAMARTEKYELNKITEMNGNGSVSVSANTGGVYASTADGTYLGQFVLTGYCPCVICCGKTNGITASGRPATANHTIAADSRFAFGTQMIINGIVYTVDDRGGAIKGNRIDIFFNTHAEALQFGKKTGDVYLYNGPSTSTSTATTTNTNQNSGGPGKVSMIGDSLMVGATSNLKALLPNANIDGKVGRQQSAGYDIVSAMKKNGTLGDTVVIELGTNGTFTENAGQKLIDNIGSDKKIYWVNTYGPKLSWYADVNSVIAKLCKNNSNVTLIDWCSKSSSNAKLFSGDGIHLTSAGYQTYAQMIYDAIK